MTDRVIQCGSFDSENFWKDGYVSKLPAIADPEAKNIVDSMDELLFPFCGRKDVLITRYKMDSSHKDYLSGLGIDFFNNNVDLENDRDSDKNKCIFQLLNETKNIGYFKELVPAGATASPFAMLPAALETGRKYGLVVDSPSMEVIKTVNSKIYSTQLKDKLDIPNCSRIVTSCSQLDSIGRELLKEGPYLVKDNFGVSGKGNVLVASEDLHERIIRYLSAQEKAGKLVEYVLEPLLDKAIDFSCQMHIDKQGKYSMLAVQKLINNNFAYEGSFTVEGEFMNLITEKGYFSYMKRIGEELYRDGYYGHVCVDSMLLKNGEIVPVVEVNARKSMSLIKHYLDLKLSKHGAKGNQTFLSVVGKLDVRFEDILENLDQEGLLYFAGKQTGILPLSANTMFINNRRGKKPYKGRLYFSIVCNDSDERKQLTNGIRKVLGNMSFNIVS